MGRKMKKLTRAGAGALAGVMVFGLAAPLAPLSVEAADEVKNLAIGSTATVNDKETDYWGADKAVDGIVNRTAAKRDQSRWATNVGGDADAKWLKIDLKEAKTFQSFVLAWERRNITGYKIQISQTGEDNSWEDVYTKTGASHISHINENIHLPEAKTARYVRLYIDGYTANAADDQTNWRSVSLYDFQIYANEIPDTVLPDENYCLEGTAEASNFEEVQSEPGKQGPAKAIDGDLTTRWATESDGKGTTARTLTVKLPAAQWVEYVKIDWEIPASGVPTPKKYTIEAAEKEGGEFTVVHTNSEQVTKAEQIIKLDKPVWAKELKLNVTEYGAATGTWYNVSVAEFGAYAMKPESGVIDENATAKQIADKLAAPTVKADKTGLEWQDVPEGVTVEFLADYEQVVGRDGKIYQPLRETKDGKVMQHENVTVTATPNKEYKFAGWYDILTGEKVSDDAEYTFAVEMNTSLIAHFTKNGETPDPQPKEWTVTIDGTGHKVKDGETLTVEEPSKPGHAFAGFYLVGTDTAVDFTKPITSDMNVESRFTQYKVTAVESENGTITVSEMNDKGEVTVTAKANDGYIFKGWKVDGKETEALGTPYTFVPVKDTTVEAVYEKKDDTKVYHTVIINGQTVTVEDGKTLDRPADPVKEGYKFIGWFVDGKEFDFNTPITGDLKIEARFEKLPTTDKNDKNDKNDKVEGAVQTGDTANAVPWIVCLGAAAGAGVVVLKSRKKRS